MNRFPGILVLGVPYLLLSSHALSSPQRHQSVPTTLPGNWTSLGCYTDNNAARTLSGAATVDTNNMTVENCIAFCDSKQFIFAGVEFIQECFCDDFIENGGANAAITECNLPCSGNSNESCGGPNRFRLNIFWSGAQPPPPPLFPASIGQWVFLGCYSHNVDGQRRALIDAVGVSGQVSLGTCTTACFDAGMPFSGAESADQCFCGTAVVNGDVSLPLSDCNMPCVGNISEFCGGPNVLTMYHYSGTDLPPQPVGGGGAGAVGVAMH
ncbi:WSC domain-containing protein [Mycena galericulata]|nr:WSC domain-containing protein [Mycena galericulata]